MFCGKCGAEAPGHAKFCPVCGADLDELHVEEPLQGEAAAIPGGEEARKKQRKIGISVLLAVFLLCAGMLIFYNQHRHAAYNGSLQAGIRYMQKGDYKRAEDSYWEAIDCAPKEEEPYLQLADLYIKQGKKDKSREILEKGEKETSGVRIAEKQEELEIKKAQTVSAKRGSKKGEDSSSYTAYLNETIIPELGLADLGEFYDEDKEERNLGLISAWTGDVDGNGSDELVTVASKDEESMQVVVTLYGMEGGEVVFRDEIEPIKEEEGSVLNDAAYWEDGSSLEAWLVKEHDGSFYLVRRATRVLGSGSCSVNMLDVYEIDSQGFTQGCSLRRERDPGSGAIIFSDDEILSKLGMGEDDDEVASCVEQLKGTLAPYGMEDCVDSENNAIFDGEMELTGLSSTDRSMVDYGEGWAMITVIQDFTDIRDSLSQEV